MDQIIMNKFNIGDKVWFKLDSYGRKAEMRGTIRDLVNVGDGWCYNIETSDHKHWNIKEKNINYSAPHTRDYNYNRKNEEKELKEDEETLKDFMNRIYEKSDFIQPFMLGDLVMYKDASKPEVFTVIEIIDFQTPKGPISYSYRIKRTARDGQDIIHLVDHDKLEKVTKSYTGGYIYPVGAHIRYEDKKQIKCGTVVHHCKLYYESKEEWYYIREDGKSSSDKCDRILGCHILGYAANWIDDPSIRKAFGLDVKNDIYENIKKQINKDQLNFHYGLNSIFKLAPNDAAVPFEISEKEHVRNDAADSLSYSIQRKLDRIRSSSVYGLNIDQTFYDDILKYVNEDKMSINDIRKMIGMEPIKEDNKMKKEQKKRNRNIIKTEKYQRTIKDITFNGPAVIVKFEPTGEDLSYGRFKGDKVVVVCKDGDKYDMKTGFLLAILKEFLNNQSYGNVLEKLDSFDTLDIPQVGKDSKFKLNQRVTTRTGCGIYTITDMTYIRGKDEWLYECVNGDFKRSFWERQLISSRH